MIDYGLAIDFQDPEDGKITCSECGAQERDEIDVENHGESWGYVYRCNACQHIWTVNVRKEE